MFSTASIRKGKKTSIGSYDQEQTRVMGDGQEEWQNPNIDTEMPRTHAIQVVENAYDGSVKAAIEGRIADAGVKRVRKDAVTHLTAFATMPDYSRRSEPEREQFEKSFKQFLEKKYGAGNVVDMRWHFDETTPHLHATVVPITSDGRLCAKELFKPTKKSMEQWQKDYYGQVATKFHYAMPDFGRSSEKGYTKSTKATRDQLECVQGREKAAEQDLAQLEAKVEQERARGRGLAEEGRELGERARELESEVEGLRAHVGRLEAAVGAVSAALAGIPAVLDMAAHKVAEGFKQAMTAFQAGLLAQALELFAQELEPEQEPEPESEREWTLDDLMENYSEDYNDGNFGSIRSTNDHDL